MACPRKVNICVRQAADLDAWHGSTEDDVDLARTVGTRILESSTDGDIVETVAVYISHRAGLVPGLVVNIDAVPAGRVRGEIDGGRSGCRRR